MKVIVYTTTHCQYCIDQKKYLKENEVIFNERNIETNDTYTEEFIELNGIGTPTTIIKDENNRIVKKVEGFDKKILKALLIDGAEQSTKR